MTIDALAGLVGAGHDNLVSVDDDDVIASVDVRREDGLVFAAQDFGGVNCQASQRFIGCIHHIPDALLFHVLRAAHLATGVRQPEGAAVAIGVVRAEIVVFCIFMFSSVNQTAARGRYSGADLWIAALHRPRGVGRGDGACIVFPLSVAHFQQAKPLRRGGRTGQLPITGL